MSVVMRMRMPSKDTVCGMVFDLCGVWFCPVKKRVCHQPDIGDIPSWCPIICQLPEGHGRLVDADALYKKRYIVEPGDILASITVVDACYISGAQTIVPAEAERSET